ncbi:hypothetical protein [Catenulispora pinisilvae]|uniref:hypothetical protein n=1 Tax=Catenulispora pinisilvae TaxID=2705253 RepID=UPI0018915625|nr:hypothetical protein [Catenulispora pinisilvae]
MGTPIADAAEARFFRYLEERQYTYDREPDDLGDTPKRPDARIQAAGHTIVAEVKAFETLGLFKDAVDGKLQMRSITDALKPLRNKIHEAARQLRDLQGRGWPLVTVLDNQAGSPIPTNPELIVSAMYGDLVHRVSITEDGLPGEARMVFGRNGKLTNDHPYISAVAIIRSRNRFLDWMNQWFDDHQDQYSPDETGQRAALADIQGATQDAPTGEEIYLEVFETVSDSAVRLPPEVFNGPLDVRWAATPGRDGLVLQTNVD